MGHTQAELVEAGFDKLSLRMSHLFLQQEFQIWNSCLQGGV